MQLLFATILPSILIVLFFVISDKFREPASQIIKVFLFGVLITIPAFFLNSFIHGILINTNMSEALIGSFFSAGPVEEGLKLLILYFFIYNMKHFNEPIDGIVYGVSVSLGFATLENYYYVFHLAEEFQTTSMNLALLRAVSAVPAHAVFGVIMGYFFMKYSYIKKGDNLIFAFLAPFLLHSLYNFFTFYNFLIALILVIISWIVALRLFSGLKKKQRKKRKEYEKKI